MLILLVKFCWYNISMGLIIQMQMLYLCMTLLTLFFSLLLILLCCLPWFYAYAFHMCLPISANGFREWFIILILFAQLTYVNVLHWMVGLYYYSFLVNEGICLILVIQTFYLFALSVLNNKDIYPISSIVCDLLLFLLLYLNHIKLFKTLWYGSHTIYIFKGWPIMLLWEVGVWRIFVNFFSKKGVFCFCHPKVRVKVIWLSVRCISHDKINRRHI